MPAPIACGPSAADTLDRARDLLPSFTDARFAAFLGVDKSLVSMWRKGTRVFPAWALLALHEMACDRASPRVAAELLFGDRPGREGWRVIRTDVEAPEDGLRSAADTMGAVGRLVGNLSTAMADGQVQPTEIDLDVVAEVQAGLDEIRAYAAQRGPRAVRT